MSKLDSYELEVLQAFESGKLKPVAGKAELLRMRAAARATAIKDRRVQLSSNFIGPRTTIHLVKDLRSASILATRSS